MNRSWLFALAVVVIAGGAVTMLSLSHRDPEIIGARLDSLLATTHKSSYENLGAVAVRELASAPVVAPADALSMRLLSREIMLPRQPVTIEFRVWSTEEGKQDDPCRVSVAYVQAGKEVSKEFSSVGGNAVPKILGDAITISLAHAPIVYVPKDAKSLSVEVLEANDYTHVTAEMPLQDCQLMLWRQALPEWDARDFNSHSALAEAASCLADANVLPRDQCAACVQRAAGRLAALPADQRLIRRLALSRATIASEQDADRLAEAALLATDKSIADRPTACVHFSTHGLSVYCLHFGLRRAHWLAFNPDHSLQWEGDLTSPRVDGFIDAPESIVTALLGS